MSATVSAMPAEREDDYAFAVEYDGPRIPYNVPRAVPINVNKVPVALVLCQIPAQDKLAIPVVKPLLATDDRRKDPSLEDSSPGTENEVNHESISCESTTTIVTERGANENLEFVGSSESSNSHGIRNRSSSWVSHEFSNEIESSITVEFSDSVDNKSPEFSSGLRELNESINQDCDSVTSFEYPSSRVSEIKFSRDFSSDLESSTIKGLTPLHDVESHNDVGVYTEDEQHGGLAKDEASTSSAKRSPGKGKKGACYRCYKGTRFTEKEACIVCDAKYCSNCVLRAMGSMPEGRKCITCIGSPINESKRGRLGKRSRMLKRFLNDLEIRQIMKAERLCEANQLPPEILRVNGVPLSHEELLTLQSCPNPPKKLKPGCYWYDKVSGFWGKEGDKPCQIISAHLNVGGPMKPNASNGNTQVYINGREITKVELRMLQLAGVQCAGCPHFWVNEDGSYQEEGQKNTKGYIWGKAGMKLICAFLSLPMPSKSLNSDGDQTNDLIRNMPGYLDQKSVFKILLIGYSGSGTSTIFKQAKILYKSAPFTDDEREAIKLRIQSNVYGYLGMLLEGRDRFEEECLARKSTNSSTEIVQLGNEAGPVDRRTVYSISPRFKSFSDFLLKSMMAGDLEVIFPAANREYAPLVEELWKDPAIQATYARKNELESLPSVASYFLERVVDILDADYEPSDLDILYAEGITSKGISCLDFSFPQAPSDRKFDTDDDESDSFLRFQLIRVQMRGLADNWKWLEMFEDAGMVILCVSLTDYDQFTPAGNNKMIASRSFFESIIRHPAFGHLDFLLILNKYDIFDEKIERVPLTTCEWFADFNPILSRFHANPSLGQYGFHYIALKFKRFYASITGKKLYVSATKGLVPDSVNAALKYAREVAKWSAEKPDCSLYEYYTYSTDGSLNSP